VDGDADAAVEKRIRIGWNKFRQLEGLGLTNPTRVSWYQKYKTKLDLLEQETVNGSGISWAICKSAPHPRQITTPAPHQSVFYRPDALPAAQTTASKHRRQNS